ncbi:MAG TPA: hypothetical protein DIT03_16480, partial [Candidatus Accumulibacter sp.]|nr:hypothetical protein [Accumulibacter sp.]
GMLKMGQEAAAAAGSMPTSKPCCSSQPPAPVPSTVTSLAPARCMTGCLPTVGKFYIRVRAASPLAEKSLLNGSGNGIGAILACAPASNARFGGVVVHRFFEEEVPMRALSLVALLLSVSAPAFAVASTIPEPESLALFATAAAALWLARGRKP